MLHSISNKGKMSSGRGTVYFIPLVPKLIQQSGDIELNPGPVHTRQTTLSATGELGIVNPGEGDEENILSILKVIQVDLKEMKNDIRGINTSIDQLNEKQQAIVQQNEQLKQEVKQLKTECESLRAECVNLRSHSTRNNVIFYDIDEMEKETWAQSENLVHEFMANTSDIQAATDDY